MKKLAFRTTPGDTIQERMENLLLRNEMINAAKPRQLYECQLCRFWPTEYDDPICDRCLVKLGLFHKLNF